MDQVVLAFGPQCTMGDSIKLTHLHLGSLSILFRNPNYSNIYLTWKIHVPHWLLKPFYNPILPIINVYIKNYFLRFPNISGPYIVVILGKEINRYLLISITYSFLNIIYLSQQFRIHANIDKYKFVELENFKIHFHMKNISG